MRGKESFLANIDPNAIAFATDTKKIFMGGEMYGGSTDNYTIHVSNDEVVFSEGMWEQNVYVSVFKDNVLVPYNLGQSNITCSTLSLDHKLLDEQVYWTFGETDNGIFYYKLTCLDRENIVSGVVPFTVTIGDDIIFEHQINIHTINFNGMKGEIEQTIIDNEQVVAAALNDLAGRTTWNEL